jgi:hypothetical protein
MTATVGFTLGFQPLIVPSSVAKMNAAGPDMPFSDTTKSVVELYTCPVGVPFFVPEAEGIVTTKDCLLPMASYKVDSPVPWSLTQNGPPGA